MNSRSFIAAILMTSFVLFFCHAGYGQEIKGPYFGQAPPGKTPALFAPDVLNNPEGYHSATVFSPEGTEVYFSVMAKRSVISVMKSVNGVWTPAQNLRWDSVQDGTDPTLSRDGMRLFFLSFQPSQTDPTERERIWFADRTAGGWSKPQRIDSVVAAHATHWTFSVAANNNLYFTSEKGSDKDIYVARFERGNYRNPVTLGPSVNGPGKEFCPYIAPDESYLVFTRMAPGTRRTDLYVSFRTKHSSWTEAKSLGETINSDRHEVAPVVTADNKYLFFVSTRSGVSRIYWVDVAVIEELRPRGN